MSGYPDFAEAIKTGVSMREVAEMYGFAVSRRTRKICCPFHDDKKPSMQIYTGRGGWFCFVCNEGGDVIKFVQRYFNLSFMEAQKKLNDDFRLGLPIGEKLRDEERKKAAAAIRERDRQRRERQEKEKELLTAYYAAYDRFVFLDMMKMESTPKPGDTKVSQDFIYASQRIDEAWYNVQTAADRLREFKEDRP